MDNNSTVTPQKKRKVAYSMGVLIFVIILFCLMSAGILTKKSILMRSEGFSCTLDEQCLSINCSKYDSKVISGYKPYCVENKCKCMCYGCQ